MTARQLSLAILCLGALALGASTYLGSPWPGVVLCGLALVPWALVELMVRAHGPDSQRIEAMMKTLDKHSNAHLDVAERLEEHQQQINSLRNAVSLRGTLGG